MQQLRLKAEEAKNALTTQNIYNEKLGDIWCSITKITFEELIQAKVQETLNSCEQALKDAKLSAS